MVDLPSSACNTGCGCHGVPVRWTGHKTVTSFLEFFLTCRRDVQHLIFNGLLDYRPLGIISYVGVSAFSWQISFQSPDPEQHTPALDYFSPVLGS